jgi:hypothetical protein
MTMHKLTIRNQHDAADVSEHVYETPLELGQALVADAERYAEYGYALKVRPLSVPEQVARLRGAWCHLVARASGQRWAFVGMPRGPHGSKERFSVRNTGTKAFYPLAQVVEVRRASEEELA